MPLFGKKGQGKDKDSGSSKRREKASNRMRRSESESGEPRVHYGDQIRVKNGRVGKVTCIGPKENRQGTWVRLVMDKSASAAASPRSRGGDAVWIPLQRVEKVLEPGGIHTFTVGDRVMVTKKKQRLPGVVKFIGPTHFKKGEWFGVELDQTKGKNDGYVKGKFYFECKKNHGLFVSERKLEPEDTKTPRKRKKRPSTASSTTSAGDGSDEEDESKEVDEAEYTPNGIGKNGHDAPHNGHFEYGSSDTQSDSDETTTPNSVRSAGSFARPRPKELHFQEKLPLQGFLPLFDDPDGHADRMRDAMRTGKPKKRKITLKGLHKDLYESKYPPLLQAPKSQREEMFQMKLRLCRAICQFKDLTKVKLQMIEKKEKILAELSEFIARHHWFKEELFESCLHTVQDNLFRTLPYQYRPPALSFFNDDVFEKDTNFEDPAWRHLKLVYDLTWRVINTQQVTAHMMEKHMHGEFLSSLVELFASEDHRERAYLMMILHKIYGRCLKLRPYIIHLICTYLYRMIHTKDFDHFNGIIELLQIICAIIPGLTVPVKDTWQKFLRLVLVPLHKCRGLKKFWEQLTQCCVNYVAKDGQGGAVILGGLLKYWPKQSPQKEEIFIMEVVNIINVLINHQEGFVYENYKEILIASAHQLTQCMLSPRQPVAERAIAAWKEQSMQHLCDYDRKAFLPKLADAFFRNRDHHNQQLRMSSNNVEKIYKSKDSGYWKKMQQYLTKKERKEVEARDYLIESTAVCRLPDFPFIGRRKKDEEKDEKRRDSFEVFCQEKDAHLPFEKMLDTIHEHEEDITNRKRKRKHLTKAELEVKRKARWAVVFEMAKEREPDDDERKTDA